MRKVICRQSTTISTLQSTLANQKEALTRQNKSIVEMKSNLKVGE